MFIEELLMLQSILKVLRCPHCGNQLTLQEAEVSTAINSTLKTLVCPCGKTYAIKNGVLDLRLPMSGTMKSTRLWDEYDEEMGAEQYDELISWLFNLFFAEELKIRKLLVEKLELKTDSYVLEVSCGTGSNLPLIAEKVHAPGKIFALDISPTMIYFAQQKTKSKNITPNKITFVLGNALNLPFTDSTFDAVLHFGGINSISDKRKMLHEMVRVTKPQGKVVICDEGVAPWLQNSSYGMEAARINSLFKSLPPLSELPETAYDVKCSWISSAAFYLIEFYRGVKVPQLNKTLRLPRSDLTLEDFLGKETK